MLVMQASLGDLVEDQWRFTDAGKDRIAVVAKDIQGLATVRNLTTRR
jgi:hypothetical protein